MIIDFIYKLFKFKNDQYSANYILFKDFFTTRYIEYLKYFYLLFKFYFKVAFFLEVLV